MASRNGFLILACVWVWGFASHADGNSAGAELGFVYGLSVPDAANVSQFRVAGVRGVAFVTPQVSFGGYFLESDHSGQLNTANQFQYSLTGIEAAYHVPTASGETYFAFRMGVAKVQESPNGVLGTFSPYHYGVATGYNYFLGDHFSIGFEGSYLHVLPGRSDASGTQVDVESFNLINFLAIVQVRF